MPKRLLGVVFVIALGLGGGAAAQQPTSEGHPHKWQVIDKSMADLVGDGFALKAVVYDTAETGPTAEPDVHYFLQKAKALVRCDFRKRHEASIYWCYRLVAPKAP